MTPFSFPWRVRAASLAVLCVCGGASASVHSWDYTVGGAQPGVTQVDNTGGTFRHISSSYDAAAQRMSWSVEFSDRVSQGVALAITGGASPLNHRGAVAMIYFDASAVVHGLSNVPRLTAYSYNGHAAADSWYDADGNPSTNSGVPQGDVIKSSVDGGWVVDSSAGDVTLPGGGRGRRFSFTIDTTALISHTPEYTDTTTPVLPWTGTGFGDRLGLFMTSSQVFDTEYAPDGSIDWLGTELSGALQGGNIPTDPGIPSPGAGVLVMVGLGLWPQRHR